MNVQEILSSHFKKKQKENEYFSLRLFARNVGLSPSYLSLIFSGKRKLQLKYLGPICEALDLDKETQNEVYSLFIKENSHLNKGKHFINDRMTENPSKKKESIVLQNRKMLSALNPWYNLAVLDATLLKDFDGTREWISKKLNLSLEQINEAVDKLLDLGLLVEEDKGLKKVDKTIEFRSSKSPAYIREHHSQYMDVAKNILKENTDEEFLEERLISGLTVVLSQNKAQDIKARLNRLLYEIIEESEQDSNTTEVYRFSVQFFPIK